ncbi:hypothetical protein [Streptomyces sp. NPDC046727]|uniref:hypothetical protein n=1 Tax=Streptomyces sp. NPDC046727 TaxID=3155373 RepID=UPI0033F1E4A6
MPEMTRQAPVPPAGTRRGGGSGRLVPFDERATMVPNLILGAGPREATDRTVAAVPTTATRPSPTALDGPDSGTVFPAQPYVRGAYALAPAGEREEAAAFVEAAAFGDEDLTSRRRLRRAASAIVADTSGTQTAAAARVQSPAPGTSWFTLAAEECAVIGDPPFTTTAGDPFPTTAHDPCQPDDPVVAAVRHRAVAAPHLARTAAFWERRHISRFRIGILR